jgi:hypothetical protein
VKPGPLPRVGLAVTVVAVVAGAGWAVFGSAATLTVTPKNASAFRTCVLTGYPTSATVMADSWADQNAVSSNKGTGITLQVKSRSNENNRAFVRFHLANCVPTVPSSSTVKKATLRLNLAGAPTASRTYNINRVTGPCPEAATTCWSENSLTWNNQPAVAATATSTLALTTSSTVNQYHAFDVTTDVAAMVAGTVSNYGWRIADSAENAASAVIVTFKSKNATSNAAGAPQLVIAYSP